MKTFESFLSKKKKSIEKSLDKFLPSPKKFPQLLHKAMRYTTLSDGKRLRPILTLMIVEMLGNSRYDAMPALCALEAIHTYSLIHDDLPAMDNDDSRRGKPSCHRVFGEAIAILAGNALHNFAFELISEAKYPPETGNKLIQELAKNSGTRGVLGGQVLDINSNNAKVTPSVLQELYLRKTASLFITAGNMACILANAPRKETNIILNFCRNIGVLFQIVDDIIDDQSSNGRTRNKNITCSRIYSVDKAIQLAKYRARIAVNSLSYFKNKAHLLQQFPNFILSKASNEAI